MTETRHDERHRILRFALASLLPLLFAPTLSATSFVRVADEDLFAQSDLIAEVEFRSAAYAEKTGMPMTDYTADVLDVLHQVGNQNVAVGSSLTVRVHGGQSSDGLSLKIWGAPEFGRGERALLFLSQGQDGTYRVKHLLQGFFKIGQTQAGVVAYRDFGDAEEVSLPHRSLQPEGLRDLDRFKAWVRDRSQGQQRVGDYTVTGVQVLENARGRYTYMMSSGFPIRWSSFGSGIRWKAHQAGQPGLASGGFAEFQAALSIWTDEGGSNVQYYYDGTTTATNGLKDGQFDGLNTIVFDDLDGAGEFDEPFDCGSGGTIAVGGPWFNSGVRHTHNGQTFVTAQGADIVTNKNLACWIRSSSAEEVFTHELGHTLGLGHSCGDPASGSCNTTAKNQALMRATAHDDGRGGQLGSDDLAGLYSLYGTGTAAPEAPSNLQATVASTTQINLSWNDNSNNETGFEIERRIGGGSFAFVTTVSSSSYQDTNLSSGTSYTYRVRATNSGGNSAYSNEAAASTSGEKAPSNLTATALTFSSVRLNWVDNSTSETGFEIEAKLLGNFEKVATTAAGATTTTVNGLIADADYSFRVRAIGGLGTSSYSNTATASTPLAPIAACTDTAAVSCLNGERFKVEVKWKTPTDQGNGAVAPLGTADSGLFYFFSANNWEMLVKVLDGCGINNKFWVFAAATTNVEYTLVVTDTRTGRTSIYFNPLNNSAAAITDTNAFATCNVAPSGAAAPTQTDLVTFEQAQWEAISPWLRPVVVSAGMTQLADGPSPGQPATSATGQSNLADGPSPGQPATSATGQSNLADGPTPGKGEATAANCTPSDSVLCLNGGRFKVELTWSDFIGQNGAGHAVVGTADSGLMWFFNASNWEILVKVLDGCAFNGRYWVFAAATTNVAYSLKVTDTNFVGVSKTYSNALGIASPAFTDTNAFNTCP